jgi:hypothetical protein
MFKYLTKRLQAVIVIKQLYNCRRISIQLLLIEVARHYLRGVQMVHSAALGLMRIGLLIALIAIGVLLFHLGVFILLPWRMETKAILGIILGLTYVVIGAVVFHGAINEKMWMEKSGASMLLRKATEPPDQE